MKYLSSILFAAIICAGTPSGAQTVVHDCHFFSPLLVAGTGGYTRITMPDCTAASQPGVPQIPFHTVKLLLPPGTSISGITAESLSASAGIDGFWKIDFGRTPRSPAAAFSGADVPDAEIYNSTNLFPASPAVLVSVQRMDGCDIAVLRVYPVRYAPVPGRLVFTPDIRVTLSLTGAGTLQSAAYSPAAAGVSERVTGFVDNAGSVSASKASSPLYAPEDEPAAAFDYLIISSAGLMPYFQPLIDLKTSEGLSVKTETMANIATNFTGIDSAEKLRNFIRYARNTWGVRYVLLGGDNSIVPCRGVYARCAGITLTSMPSDLYFACLDGSWNSNSNSVWGEPADDVDLIAEVYVGRAPVETAAETSNFVAKCMAGEQAEASRFKACLAGECLENGAAQGGNALDTLLPSLDSSLCAVSWLDDRPALSAVWSGPDAVTALNRSPLLVAHFGHGSDSAYDTTVMRLTVPELDALANSDPFLLYSTACNTGAFDNDQWGGDCIAEELVKHNLHGAFALLANAREGWYDSTDEERYSGEFQKYFFGRLLAGEQTRIGDAHQLAKQDLLGNVEISGTSMPYRWCYFGINLFGDPHAAVRVPLSVRFTADAAGRTVTWNSWSNRTYNVFSTTSLYSQTWTCMASNIVPTPPLNTWTNAVSGNCGFYRVIGE